MKNTIMFLGLLLMSAFSLPAQIVVPEGDTLNIKIVTGADTVVVTDTIRVVELDTIFVAPDTVFATDTLVVTDTLIVVDTVFVGDTIIVEIPVADSTPPAHPSMYIAGYTTQDDNGLHVQWEAQPADSFLVYGGEPSWSVTVPGSHTVYRKPLSFTVVTRQWACVIAFWHDIASTNQCDSMDWAPMPPGSWEN